MWTVRAWPASGQLSVHIDKLSVTSSESQRTSVVGEGTESKSPEPQAGTLTARVFSFLIPSILFIFPSVLTRPVCLLKTFSSRRLHLLSQSTFLLNWLFQEQVPQQMTGNAVPSKLIHLHLFVQGSSSTL